MIDLLGQVRDGIAELAPLEDIGLADRPASTFRQGPGNIGLMEEWRRNQRLAGAVA